MRPLRTCLRSWALSGKISLTEESKYHLIRLTMQQKMKITLKSRRRIVSMRTWLAPRILQRSFGSSMATQMIRKSSKKLKI